MPLRRDKSAQMAALAVLLLIAGCATAPVAPDISPLRTEVEQLYVNYHALEEIRGRLQEAVLRHLEQGGGQLPEMQSAARFIDQANMIAYYQWSLLSITEYIRDSARPDFFSLRMRDVADARRKSADLILAIQVYEAFLRDPDARELITKCIGHIEQNVSRYETLQQLMAPLANPPDPGMRPAL